MPQFDGTLHKMPTLLNSPVEYHLPVGQKKINLNQCLGQKISLRYCGEIYCIQCGRKTRKSFQQGYCFPCYRQLLACNLCMIYPEKCRYYEGVCQAGDWAHAHCGQPHVLYLANSSGLKVGITRASHIPGRWIDQGATQGLVIMRMSNRHLSGLLEVAIKQHIADKTNWRAMLKGNNQRQDLFQTRTEVLARAEKQITDITQCFAGEIELAADMQIQVIDYPVLEYPTKISTFDFDKNPLVEGRLIGIKAQYLILDTGVISIRKFAGYRVSADIG